MITGGGTGGHTSPAVAIIEELQRRDPQLTLRWVGRRGSIEERVCQNLSIPFRSVPVEGWPRSGMLKKLRAGLRLAVGIARAAVHIQTFRPQVVIGVGGYVSVPAIWVAQQRGIPTVLHEQNKRLGMANRLLGKKANRLLLSFPDTLGDYPKDRAVVVGNPVRSGFYEAPSEREARERFEMDPDIPLILVCGGSQGARTLNTAMTQLIPEVGKKEFQFIWMTGQSDAASAREVAAKAPARVDVYPFIDDMVGACAAATLIVSRAGASSTAEIATLGKPSILIPYPHATDNHQEENARAFQTAGAAEIVLDAECTAGRLLSAIRGICGAPDRLGAMGEAARRLARPVAVESIVDEVFALVFPS